MIITDRQYEIIKAAGKILTNSGVGGLTIKKLAKEMNFSEAAIYRHFPSKENIILAMLEFLAISIDNRLKKELEPEKSADERFLAIFKNQFTFFQDNSHFVVSVFSDGLMEESEKINAAIIQIMDVKMKYLKPIIEDGQSENIFRNDIPATDLIHITMSTMRLQMYKWRVANFEFDNVTEGEKIMQSVLILLKKK